MGSVGRAVIGRGVVGRGALVGGLLVVGSGAGIPGKDGAVEGDGEILGGSASCVVLWDL